MIESAAARMRRRSGLPERVAVAWSWSCWSLVYACTVVMRPCSMPNASCSTLAIGARQFVVHDAFEMTVCCVGSNTSSFTPMQIIASASPDGAEMIDALGAALQVRGGLLPRREETGRLDHDVDAVVAPRDLRRLALLELLDLAAVDREAVAVVLDLVRERAADRVVLQQERHRLARRRTGR